MTTPATLKVPIPVKIPDSFKRKIADLESDVAALEAEIAARPGLRWRGRFDISVEYEPGDCVTYRGSSFVFNPNRKR